ncbi:NUDIX hydrolase [Arthrobacter sp. Soil763]|uniref:NUDIX hydrolase n=1 Tax=Arthrobacter sp. Soil763 TaxID=1736402 RepID=UPI0006F8DCA2|nr:NUDIX hydrolase [Arthrobacter sp. Soil763]KRE79422.1 NUDIX hydrolase [Arthrobacter sp. Soil763]
MPHLARRLFVLPPELEGAARSWLEHGERTPRAPRYASSVVLLRDSPTGLETWLGYRPGSSPLGVLAFPGGSLEATDDDAVGWLGPPPQWWAEQMGTTDIGLARRHVVGAIRELFEETGILLAGPDLSTTVEATSTAEWMRAREAVAEQEKSFTDVLGKRGLSVRTDLLKPLVNWLSPDFAHRRFNTRYFAATVPVNQQPSLLASKGVWGRWVCVRKVVDERETTTLGDEVGQPNTVGLTLGQLLVPGSEIMLEKMAAANGCIAYLSYKRKAHAYQPVLVEEEGKLVLEVEAAKTVAGEPQRER